MNEGFIMVLRFIIVQCVSTWLVGYVVRLVKLC